MKPNIKLVHTLHLPDFPSGSSVNFFKDHFYLIGDDATNILVLDKNYQRKDSIHLFDFSEKRIPKPDKTDLEGSAIISIEGVEHLLVVGSASRKNRKRILSIPFSENTLNFKTLKNAVFKTKTFVKRIQAEGIDEVNIEGVSLIKQDLLLGNRGNRASQNNHLIITDKTFWLDQENAKLIIRKLVLPAMDEILGLSELLYIETLDLLLITFSSEATDNAFDDGAIGSSYLGWVEKASRKLEHLEIHVDGSINLSSVDAALKDQKIEGICLESIEDSKLILHLISDNDLGESVLFKLEMTL